MAHVFLSYSNKDYLFAELAEIKLSQAGIEIWREQRKLRAGEDWRDGIEKAISNSLAVIIALSENSASSSYVTYEWAYALGKGKPVIPMKLNECKIHPKLEAIQYLDFSTPSALPWELLVERIREIEPDITREDEGAPTPTADDVPLINAILAYLNQRGYQIASFDRLRRRIDESIDDARLESLVHNYPNVFRPAKLANGKRGLAKVIP